MRNQSARQEIDHSVIETSFLRPRIVALNQAFETSRSSPLVGSGFLLDIDLDYFHTKEAVCPADAGFFYSLIRDCCAITIARENHCVELCRLEGETIDSDQLQESIEQHIHSALS